MDEACLPPDIFARATRSRNEYGWPADEIPRVIEAARAANLVNIGGQLQFIMPGATCECYWIEVDTFKQVSKSLHWKERVELTAAAALDAFQCLREKTDFVAEGRKAFGEHIAKYEASGGNISDAMRFIWYIEAAPTS